MVEIQNDDLLCMARAIGVSWLKTIQVSNQEWQELTKDESHMTMIEKVLHHRKAPLSYYKNVSNKNRKEQKNLALRLCREANIPINRMGTLNDIQAFETVLDVQILVISAMRGNKFVRVGENRVNKIYIYLDDEEQHFHSITKIAGFFGGAYFCEQCLKPYNGGKRGQHVCETACMVCKSKNCIETEPVVCVDCNMTCRNKECMERHKVKGKEGSQCDIWWKCTKCHKVVDRREREIKKHQCGEYRCLCCDRYFVGEHLCYIRSDRPSNTQLRKLIYFDFACSQDEASQCELGYEPNKKLNCKKCIEKKKTCSECKRCKHCKEVTCGKQIHEPNFVVAQTSCDSCKDWPQVYKM